MPISFKITGIPVCGVCLLLSACDPVDDRMEIKEERVLPIGHEAPELGRNLKARLGPDEDLGMQRPEAPEPEPEPAGPGGNIADLLVWETPEGWTEAPATAMRLVNLRFGEGDVGECYLTVLMGGGGGLDANIGRWYGQMGKTAPSAEEIAALPRATLMRRSAVVVDVEGTFSGMGAAAKENYRMVGRILPPEGSGNNSFSMFLKMTGPAAEVEANLEKFKQFSESLAPRG